MDVSGWLWALTIVGLVGLLAFDFFAHVRRAHVPTLAEAAAWSVGYIAIAVLFGLGMFVSGGADAGSEYFAGYLTEKALSVDNLFVFLVIMAGFRVPRVDQQKVLLFGIVMALAARTGFILLGAVLIHRFSWIFYFFGLLLLLAAGNMLRSGSTGASQRLPDVIVGLVQKVVPTTARYDGDRLFTRIGGRWVITPMLLVMLAIAGTDVLFALDSIPAIFGLTQNTYIVFTATAFSLLGLRQLYFLIDGLLDRLVYLSHGLSVILGFIGIKLIMHAMHEQGAGGIEIGTGTSLLVIVGVLAATVIASLRHRRHAPRSKPEREPELALRR